MAMVPVDAALGDASPQGNVGNAAARPSTPHAKGKSEKKVHRRKGILMLEQLLKGKETEIKCDSPYLMVQLKNMKRVAIMIDQMVADPNLIETAEIAICSKDLVKLGSPREKDKVETEIKKIDTSTIKKVGDISPHILVGFLRQHGKKLSMTRPSRLSAQSHTNYSTLSGNT